MANIANTATVAMIAKIAQTAKNAQICLLYGTVWGPRWHSYMFVYVRLCLFVCVCITPRTNKKQCLKKKQDSFGYKWA